MVDMEITTSILRRKCHERQDRVSRKDYNAVSPYAGTGERRDERIIRESEVPA
jgi:hypothetical protein